MTPLAVSLTTPAGPGRRFQAMKSPVVLTVPEPWRQALPAATMAAQGVFAEVEREASRFDPDSSLSRLNRTLGTWQEVSPLLWRLLKAAHRAYRKTNGLFDPRILPALVHAGYGDGITADQEPERLAPGPFLSFRPGQVRLAAPLDLGGIGKGFAVDEASRRILPDLPVFSLNAGGDVYLAGPSPSADLPGWTVGVENPWDLSRPLFAFSLPGPAAVATSSLGRHHWLQGDRFAHHLIDPQTGAPSGSDLMAVTAVAPRAAWAEVLTKALFLLGSERAGVAAATMEMPVYLIDREGRIRTNAAGQHALLPPHPPTLIPAN